jgi:pheromone shutdown protein TraB
MYTKLESEGFKAGDEFATSVREGLAIGATIVLGDRDVEVTLRQLTRDLTKTYIRNSFVKTMKAKDNIKKIMSALRTTAPEIYDAMVAERDVYMGKGLDELTLVGGSSIDRTVAVVGMAHVDGLERYLASKGWTEMRYPCPIIR